MLRREIRNYSFLFFMSLKSAFEMKKGVKDKFMEIFNPKSDSILFPSICFEPHHKVGIHPRVSDMMMYVPKKYIDYFKQHRVNLGHNTWYDLIERFNFNYTQLDMMLNTYHDSDSAKDYNPIYYIVNRPENSIHTTKKVFDKEQFYKDK